MQFQLDKFQGSTVTDARECLWRYVEYVDTHNYLIENLIFDGGALFEMKYLQVLLKPIITLYQV